MSPTLRGLLWALASCLLLLLGFGAAVLGVYALGVWLGAPGAGSAPNVTMLAVYFRVVLFKGLLPQLLLALALWPLLRRGLPGLARRAPAAGLALAALAAYAVVAPLLLSVELPGWPALQMRSSFHHLSTALLSLAAVVAAAWSGRRLVFGARLHAP